MTFPIRFAINNELKATGSFLPAIRRVLFWCLNKSEFMKCQISLVLDQSTSINFEMSVTFVNKKIVTRGVLLLVGQAHVSHTAWLGEIWLYKFHNIVEAVHHNNRLCSVSHIPRKYAQGYNFLQCLKRIKFGDISCKHFSTYGSSPAVHRQVHELLCTLHICYNYTCTSLN